VKKGDGDTFVFMDRSDVEKEAKPISGHLIRWRGEYLVEEEVDKYARTW
jgi:hypothetical protein